jgi:hypothetical protein
MKAHTACALAVLGMMSLSLLPMQAASEEDLTVHANALQIDGRFNPAKVHVQALRGDVAHLLITVLADDVYILKDPAGTQVSQGTATGGLLYLPSITLNATGWWTIERLGLVESKFELINYAGSLAPSSSQVMKFSTTDYDAIHPIATYNLKGREYHDAPHYTCSVTGTPGPNDGVLVPVNTPKILRFRSPYMIFAATGVELGVFLTMNGTHTGTGNVIWGLAFAPASTGQNPPITQTQDLDAIVMLGTIAQSLELATLAHVERVFFPTCKASTEPPFTTEVHVG